MRSGGTGSSRAMHGPPGIGKMMALLPVLELIDVMGGDQADCSPVELC